MRVLIRADASIAIGSGHVARCLTLAHALRKRGADVQFACRLLSGHLLQRLREQGYTAFGLPQADPQEQGQGGSPIEANLPWQTDIEALAEALEGEPPFDWLIVDHYGLDARWERAAGRFASRLMAIDDLANRPHAADVLLDQNFSAQVSDNPYAQWIPRDCRALLGPHFALLRDEFQCQPIAIKPRVERVLVNFGGFDAACQVHASMLALQGFNDLQVDFVAGLHNPQWEAMTELTRGRPTWRLHGLVDDFFGLMQQADLFVGAGGATTWERAALGLPTICISVAPNQQLNARLLAEAGIHLYLGSHEQLDMQQRVRAIASLLGGASQRQAFAERSRGLVDGYGAGRVADTLAGHDKICSE